jgi:hypothetical protein
LKNKIQNNNTIPHNDLFKLLVGARYYSTQKLHYSAKKFKKKRRKHEMWSLENKST